MVESDLNPLENRQVSRRVTTMLCCWIRMLLSWRSCCGVKLRQLELVRSCWNLAKLPKLQLKPVLVKAKHYGHGQKLMEIIAQVKSEFYWCFLKGLGCFFFVSHFCGWNQPIQIHPDHEIIQDCCGRASGGVFITGSFTLRMGGCHARGPWMTEAWKSWKDGHGHG